MLSVDQCVHMRETSSNVPICTLGDFKGVRIRTMDNPYFMQMWNELGASPTPLAFSEIYLSLQQPRRFGKKLEMILEWIGLTV